MSRQNLLRMASVVAVVLLLPASAAMAGGASAPPPPGLVLITSDITARVLIDTHDPFAFPATSSAKSGYIILARKHFATPEIVFRVPLFGNSNYSLGCDLSSTNSRFVSTMTPVVQYTPMNSWMNDDVVAVLFQQIGITTSAALQPTITAVVAQACLPAGAADSVAGIPNPGILEMVVDIGFWAPPGTQIPKK